MSFPRCPINVARKSALPLAIIVWLSVFVVPSARSEESTNQVRSATETAREEARERRASLPIAKGTLQDIDLFRRQLKLKTEDGVRTFTYTTRTYVFRDKEKITADKLKVGEVIAVRFDTDKDGNHTLTRIKTDNPRPPSEALLSAVSTNRPILGDSLMRDGSPAPTPPVVLP